MFDFELFWANASIVLALVKMDELQDKIDELNYCVNDCCDCDEYDEVMSRE